MCDENEHAKFENEKWWCYWYWYFLTRTVIIIGNMYEGGEVISKFQIIDWYLLKGVFPRGPVGAHGCLRWVVAFKSWWSIQVLVKILHIVACSVRWRCRRGNGWWWQGGSPGAVAEVDIFCAMINCSHSKGRSLMSNGAQWATGFLSQLSAGMSRGENKYGQNASGVVYSFLAALSR